MKIEKLLGVMVLLLGVGLMFCWFFPAPNGISEILWQYGSLHLNLISTIMGFVFICISINFIRSKGPEEHE